MASIRKRIAKDGNVSYLVTVFAGFDGNGKMIRRSETVRGSKADAKVRAGELEAQKTSGTLPSGAYTVGDLLQAVEQDYQINGKCLWWVQGKIRKHLKPYFSAIPAAKLTTDTVRAYTAKRLKAGAAAGTINRELAILHRAYAMGRQSTPPKVAIIPFMPKLQEDNVRKGFFEEPEYRALLTELPDYLKPLLTFAYFTGVRKGEALGLRWSQIDLVARVVRLEVGETKSGEGRTIPLSGELLEVIRMQRARRDAQFPFCPFVFFGDLGEAIRDFRDSWSKACCRAGLWIGDEATGKPGRIFHDLRRSGVRNLIRAGVPEAVAMRISGHKTRAIFDRYNIVSERDLHEAMRRLDAYRASQAQETPPIATKLQHRGDSGKGPRVQ